MSTDPEIQEENKLNHGERAFIDLVREAPSLEDVLSSNVISITGVILRSEDGNKFLLALPGGRTLQLPTDAVRSHRIVEETGSHRLVQIEVAADSLSNGALLTLAQQCADATLRNELAADDTDPGTSHLPKDVCIADPALMGHTTHLGRDMQQYSVLPGGNAGLTPFVLATPHQATQAIQIQQYGYVVPPRKPGR